MHGILKRLVENVNHKTAWGHLVAQAAKWSTVTPAALVAMLFQVPGALFPIQLPGNVTTEETEDDACILAPAIHMGDLDGVQCS